MPNRQLRPNKDLEGKWAIYNFTQNAEPAIKTQVLPWISQEKSITSHRMPNRQLRLQTYYPHTLHEYNNLTQNA